MYGSAANGLGMADGSGCPDAGVIRPIPELFGFKATGIGDSMVGAGQRDIGADPGRAESASLPLADNGLKPHLNFFRDYSLDKQLVLG